MDQSFADRLSRNQSSTESVSVPNGHQVDLIGTTGTRTQTAAEQAYEHPTWNQKFNLAVINNLILGFIWMAATGYIAANFFAVIDGFLGADGTTEGRLNLQVGIGVALTVSFGLFYWVVREAIREVGKLHGMPASLAIGGVIGLLVGAGPVTVFNLLVSAGYL